MVIDEVGYIRFEAEAANLFFQHVRFWGYLPAGVRGFRLAVRREGRWR
jgi:hypothetical protein